MGRSTLFEMLLVFLMFASGGIGLPLGMPPGPEDPVLGKFADDDAQMYFAWTGMGAIQGSDPTSKWMAKPEILLAVGKLKEALQKELGGRADRAGEMSLLRRLAIKTLESSVNNGASIFATDIELDGRSPEFKGAILIPLADQKMELEQLVTQLESVVAKADKTQCDMIEKDGLTRIRIAKDLPVPVEFLIKENNLVIGIGEGMLDRGLKNIQTEPPVWFTEYRKRLKVEKFSSVAYLSGTILESVKQPVSTFIDIESLTAICFVSGIDDEGAVSRAALDLKPGSQMDKLLPRQPLRTHELARMAKRPLFGLQTHIPVEEVISYIATVGKQIGDDPVADAEEQFEEMFGLSLQEEMLNVFDGFAGASFDVDLVGNRPEVIISLGISDEMSFPAVYETVIETISQWPDVEDRLKTSTHRNFEIFEVTPKPMGFMFFPVELCWAHANDQLIFATDTDLIAAQIDRMIDGDTFADSERAKQLIEFGKENNFGNPVAVSTLDPVKLMEVFFHFTEMFRFMDDDDELFSGFTFGDIPKLEVLSEGLDSAATGVYRTPEGIEAFSRHTPPGSSPPVTMLVVGGASFTSSNRAFDTPQTKMQNNLRQVLLACLNFESAWMKFPATGTKNADGQPLLSWRVHILPYIDEVNLYKQFHLDEPWDSEHNKTLIEKMPDVYCHVDMESSDGKTVFLGIAGEEGVLGTPQEKASGQVGFGKIVDGSSNTALAVAVEPSSAVIWSKPDDLKADDGEKAIEATDENEDGTMVGLADGSVHVFEDLDAGTWESLMKISDGEVIDINALAK